MQQVVPDVCMHRYRRSAEHRRVSTRYDAHVDISSLETARHECGMARISKGVGVFYLRDEII